MPDLEHAKTPSSVELEIQLAKWVSNLYGCLRADKQGGAYALNLKMKQGGLWIAWVKRFQEETAAPQIAFGTGKGIGAALVALNKAIAQNDWKSDKPWKRD